MSYICLTYHLVFSTKHRYPSIVQLYEKELYAYLYKLALRFDAKVWRIGGMPDHVHFMCDIPPKISVSDFVKIMKSESSKFMKINAHFPQWQGWSEGYGAFSIGPEGKEACLNYIKRQKEHHLHISFADEFLRALHVHGLEEPMSPNSTS